MVKRSIDIDSFNNSGIHHLSFQESDVVIINSKQKSAVVSKPDLFDPPKTKTTPLLSSTTLGQDIQNHNQVIDKSFIVIYILTVVAEAARGLVLPTLWPYFSEMGGKKASLGLLVSIYSLGRMFSVIPLGYLSDCLSASTILQIASALQACGHLLYIVAPSISVLFFSRMLVGFGSATTSIARAHITKSVSSEDRTCHLAYLSGLQFFGFAVLPIVAGIMAFLPECSILGMKLNLFTYPAFLLMIANLLCAIIVYKFYTDPVAVEENRLSCDRDTNNHTAVTKYSSISVSIPDTHKGKQSSDNIKKPNYSAAILCLLINLVFRGISAQLETISIPFMIEQFHISPSSASIYMGIIGIFGTMLYFCFKPLSTFYSDRLLALSGLVFIAIGCLPLSLRVFTEHMSLFIYLILLAFTWSIAYPIGQTAVLSLFSKTLRGMNVGSFMGVFSATGAISPMVLSVVASSLWDKWGRESVFGFTFMLVVFALAIMGSSYGKLVC